MYTVYCLQVNDGRRYIGTTSQPVKTRWNHGNGYRFHKELWDLITLEKWESIQKTILGENLTEEEASLIEQEYIEKYDTTNPEKGFNREKGGVKTRKIIPSDVRQKIAQSCTGVKNHNYGTHFSEEHKLKLSESNKGQKRSEETRRNIGLSKEKPVNQYTREGVLLVKWRSGLLASISTGIDKGHISDVCKGQRSTAGGYVWKFATQ